MRGHARTRRRMGPQASRRHFFKLLAGSPLLATAYPLFPPDWQRGGRRLRRARPARSRARPHLRRLRPDVRGDRPAAERSTQTAPAAAAAAAAAGRPRRAPHRAADRHGRRGDQRLGLRARRPRQHPAPALGLHPHGRRRPRDPLANREGFQRLALRPRRLGPDGQARHGGDAVRQAVEHAAVPVPGGGARGVSHRRRERRGPGRQGPRHPADPVAPELAVLRDRSPRRAANRTGSSSTPTRTGT